jgi:hypothetical protein
MARRLLILLSLLSCALLGTAVDANAAKKKVKAPVVPTVKSISPLNAQVGEKLTVIGTNFAAGTGKTKVYFLREGGGVTWVAADTATKTRLVVTVPESLIPLLRGTAQARQPTRFQLRLLAKRFGSATKLSKSPLLTAPSTTPTDPGPGTGPVTPPDGDCDGDAIKNSVDTDDDNDGLPDNLEIAAHTDPCKADTDGDGVGDGYEYYAAKDMNSAALPYPSKKPWPNPLDSTDADIDHDGDGLTMTDEFLLWKYYGNGQVPLNYSDGLQKSADVDAPTDPTLAYMDINRDGKLSDDERDADGDGLTNWDESHGRMLQDWWTKFYDGQNAPKETPYPNTFPGVSMVDPDSDGDGIPDGADDQDHDGLSNAFEMDRPSNWIGTWVISGSFPFADPENPWAAVQPYNPCKPVKSYSCHLHPPLGYYQPGEAWHGVPSSDAGPQPTAPWTYPGATLPATY